MYGLVESGGVKKLFSKSGDARNVNPANAIKTQICFRYFMLFLQTDNYSFKQLVYHNTTYCNIFIQNIVFIWVRVAPVFSDMIYKINLMWLLSC